MGNDRKQKVVAFDATKKAADIHQAENGGGEESAGFLARPQTEESYNSLTCDSRIVLSLAVFVLSIVVLWQHGASHPHAYRPHPPPPPTTTSLLDEKEKQRQALDDAKKYKGFYNIYSNPSEEWGIRVNLDEAASPSYEADYVSFVKQAGDFDPTKARDVCVVGAGMTGTVIAERFSTVKGASVLVIDRRPHIGGNCFDFEEPETGLLVNRYGAHVIHTSHPTVWAYLNMHEGAPGWIPWSGKIAVESEDGVRATYPVGPDWLRAFASTDSPELGTDSEFREYMKEVRTPCGLNGCATEAEFLRSQVGETLYQNFFSPWFVKAFGADPESVPPGTGSLNTHSVLENSRAFREKHIVVPAQGYTRWFAALLDKSNIETVVGVDFNDYKQELLQSCGKIVYTGPIESYYSEEELARAGLAGEEFKLGYRSLRFDAQREQVSAKHARKEAIMESPDWETMYLRKVDYRLMDQVDPSQHAETVIVRETAVPLKDGDNQEPFWAVPTPKHLATHKRFLELAAKEEKTEFVGFAKYRNYNLDETIENALMHFNEMAGRPVMPDLPELSQNKKMDWLHIPKTGTSLLYQLIAYKCDEEIAAEDDQKGKLTEIYNQVAHQYKSTSPCVAGLYHGHKSLGHGPNYGFKQESPQSVVSMFREPIERIASGFPQDFHDCRRMNKLVANHQMRSAQDYCELLEKPPTSKEYEEALKVVQSYAKCVQGCQARMLAGEPCGHDYGYDKNEDHRRMGVQHYTHAVEKIWKLRFVGLVEKWTQSMCIFQKDFPRPSGFSYDIFPHIWANVRPSKNRKCTQRVAQALRSANFTDWVDQPVYEEAQRVFHQKLGRCAHTYTTVLEKYGRKGKLGL